MRQFRCTDHGVFEKLIGRPNAPIAALCPVCGSAAMRDVPRPPGTGLARRSTLHALERREIDYVPSQERERA
jgi:hypothetical protein